MDIIDRIKSYEPLFDWWLFDDLISIIDQESLIKVKHLSYGNEKHAFVKVVTVYDQDNNLKYLEKRIQDIKSHLNLNQGYIEDEFVEDEQYLIENNQGEVIGIDLCLLMKEDTYKVDDLDDLSGKLLYELGLKLFDKHEYDEALRYFKKGEVVNNSDCICIIGYLYERGLGVERDYVKAAYYYQKATSLNNIVASCNLAYFYELGIGIEQDYQKAYELYLKGAETGFPRAICNLGYCYEYGRGVKADLKQAVEYYLEAARLG